MAGKDLTIKIYNTDGYYTKMTASTVALARNHIYTNVLNSISFDEYDIYYSVSATKKVLFSPGNLQWSATGGGASATTLAVAGGGTAPGTWRFAPNQWEYIGNAPGNTTAPLANRATQTDWIDLFGWGSSGYDNTANDPFAVNFQPYSMAAAVNVDATNDYGYGPSTNMADPDLTGTSANYDWGVYNAIYNPKTLTTDAPGSWNTLSSTEWHYVLFERSTTSGIRYAKAMVNGVPGLVLVPDLWRTSIYPLASPNIQNAAYSVNDITAARWTILEKAGCTFLPVTGRRGANYIAYLEPSDLRGCYWTVTHHNYHSSFFMDFLPASVGTGYTNRFYGRAVRLVKDYVE